MQLKFSWKILGKKLESQISLQNMSIGRRAKLSTRTDRRTDGHDEANSRSSQFFKSAYELMNMNLYFQMFARHAQRQITHSASREERRLESD